MNNREILAEALRRCGASAKEITDRQAFADLNMPMQTAEVPADQVEARITHLMWVYQLPPAEKAQWLAQRMGGVKEHVAKN